ncbi:single-stranded DNA-binding protein [Patescibacteria group bacterium]|nr:single-stranded DNA-binding protein [Patescibacteria group bacterium]MCL5091807.1 single-stranded DNA-binding protein [Patescibacteria group bacterium]
MSSRSLNKVILLGNLTRDPELKYTPAGTAVCTFGIATNRSWTTADGQTKEDTQYHRIVAWQKLAELCGKLLTKGRKIYLEGRLTYRSFTGKDGIQRTISEIVMDDFIVFSDGRRPVSEDVKTGDTQAGPTQETDTPAQKNSPKPDKNKDKDAGEKDGATEPKPEEKNDDESVNPDDIPF